MSEITEISLDTIAPSIFIVRGVKAMLDSDLAMLYEVSTGQLNQAVKRNIDRFPEDFMFQLTKEEFSVLKSKISTRGGWGGRRKMPFAFTEQGIAMLSGVLTSTRAVQVNIAIMRAFVKMRKLLSDTNDLFTLVETMRN